MLEIRPFQSQDWDLLLPLANQAVPFALAENAEWFNKRREFDAIGRVRRHYLAWQDGQPAGYGGLEQQSEGLERLRIYVVAAPKKLAGTVGGKLFVQLLGDAIQLGARTLWARELLADEAAYAFFTRHAFVETQRAAPPNFAPVVVFELNLP
jgi:hypothetical protein